MTKPAMKGCVVEISRQALASRLVVETLQGVQLLESEIESGLGYIVGLLRVPFWYEGDGRGCPHVVFLWPEFRYLSEFRTLDLISLIFYLGGFNMGYQDEESHIADDKYFWCEQRWFKGWVVS